jgi:uncharacterized protein (TIGR02145 family)
MKNISLLFLSLLFVFQCSNQTTDPNTDTNQTFELGKLSLNLDISSAPPEVIKMQGLLWNNSPDTIHFDFKIKDDFATADIKQLAVGEWTLRVDAYNEEDVIIYSGSAKVNIDAGVTTIVRLHLNPATGSLEIIVTWGEETITDIDGNVYKTVRIGNQIWMAENLKVTHYRNGDPITDGSILGDYSSELAPKYRFVYNDDDLYADIYGLLYTWYVVADSRGIAPDGWHIPSDREYRELELYLGMNEADTGAVCSLEGNNIAGKLKETGFAHWYAPNSGATNESGFTALPAGYRRRFDKEFDYIGSFACFWTSTAYDELNAWYRHLYYDKSGICRTRNLKNYGFSVRCIKDK